MYLPVKERKIRAIYSSLIPFRRPSPFLCRQSVPAVEMNSMMGWFGRWCVLCWWVGIRVNRFKGHMMSMLWWIRRINIVLLEGEAGSMCTWNTEAGNKSGCWELRNHAIRDNSGPSIPQSLNPFRRSFRFPIILLSFPSALRPRFPVDLSPILLSFPIALRPSSSFLKSSLSFCHLPPSPFPYNPPFLPVSL